MVRSEMRLGMVLVACAVAVGVLAHVAADASPGEVSGWQPPARSAGFADLVERLQPAVVNISAVQKVRGRANDRGYGEDVEDASGADGGSGTQNRAPSPGGLSLGSGFIVSADGYVVTNDHVLAGGDAGRPVATSLERVTVTTADRTDHVAHVVGRDAVADVAVLKIEASKPLPFVRFGDSLKSRVGDWVVAIGNPFGLGGTVTAGIISAIHRSVGDVGQFHKFIQTDAAINSGNSGGPLFDAGGDVIGINNIIVSSGGGNAGVGFAIPAEEAKPVVELLMKGGAARHGYLGLLTQPVDDGIANALGIPKDRGAIVALVEPGSPANRAGIVRGDVVLSIDGLSVTADDTLTYTMSHLEPGRRVIIDVIRGGATLPIKAVVGERPQELSSSIDARRREERNVASATSKPLGARLTPRRSDDAAHTKSGVVVTEIAPDSDLADKGVRAGDVILSVDRRPASSAAAVRDAVAAAARTGRNSVLLLVQRGAGPTVYVGVRLTRAP